MKFSQDLIEKMKQWNREVDGTEISDAEANEALRNICEYFDTLARWDREAREKDAAEELLNDS